MGQGPGGPGELLVVLLQPLCTSDAAADGSQDRNRLPCCSTEPALRRSGCSPGCERCSRPWGDGASARGVTTERGVSLVCFIPDCSSRLLPVKPSKPLISSLLLESKDKCSLPTGVKPGENLRPARCVFRTSLWAISLGGF